MQENSGSILFNNYNMFFHSGNSLHFFKSFKVFGLFASYLQKVYIQKLFHWVQIVYYKSTEQELL